jgi:MtN3 and saliva related transmembrane protein
MFWKIIGNGCHWKQNKKILYNNRMSTLLIKSVGYLAGTGTTLSFLPQMIRVVRTGSVSDLSIYMFLIHSSGVSLWIVYGIFMKDSIILLFNAITMLFNLVILSVFLKSFLTVSNDALPNFETV